MADEVECCIIGAGVVGLAIAARLAAECNSLVVLDRNATFGQGISARNSEVIHAGIYYAADSNKARMCVEGKHRLYQFCREHEVPHARVGKLLVATGIEEEEGLEALLTSARANGVEDLEYWTRERLAREEPAVNATLALHSPSTGIVSAHDLMHALLQDAEQAGAIFTPRTRVEGVETEPDRFLVRTRIEERESYAFGARLLINAAGLGAQGVARGISGLDVARIPPLYLCKGDYFALSGASPFRHLIYPLPERSGQGLGVHATLDLAGAVRFGPDVEYVDEESYAISPGKEIEYRKSIRRYFPELGADALHPAYSGIRPKLQPEGGGVQDFVIEGPSEHGIDRLVQLFGIESPGLTAALAIAERVRNMLRHDV